MRCESCKVEVKAEFTFAIQNNQCPACGKRIMQQARLASFLSLKALLDSHIVSKDVNVDRLASLIVANFEVKQIFKEEELQKPEEGGIIETSAPQQVAEEVTEEVEEEDPDAESKARQRKEAKNILAKMRDEVLSDAVQDRYGLGGDMLLPDEDTSIHEVVNREKQAQSQSTILTGSGGKNSFSRSG